MMDEDGDDDVIEEDAWTTSIVTASSVRVFLSTRIHLNWTGPL